MKYAFLRQMFPSTCIGLAVALFSLSASQVYASNKSSNGTKYIVQVHGLKKKQILSSDNKLMKNKQGFVSNIYALKDRIENFIKSEKRKLIESGYYDADIKYSLDNSKGYIKADIQVTPGQLYKIANIKLSIKDKKDPEIESNINHLIFNKNFLIKNVGNKASAFNISNIAQWIVRTLNERGYPFIKVLSVDAIVDKNTASVDISIDVFLGQKLIFGPTFIKGLSKLNETFVKNRIYWQENNVYDVRAVEMTSYLLSNTQIFSSVNIEIDKDKITNNAAPMIVKLEEDKQRSLEISLSYSTAKTYNFQQISQSQKKLRSLTGAMAWTHYNLLNGGEQLKFKVSGSPFSIKSSDSPRDYELSTEFSKPDFFMPMDSLVSYICYDRASKNAYYKLGKSLGAYWKSGAFLPDLKLQLGVEFEDNSVNGPENSFEQYKAFCFPISITFDTRNSILNPTNGYKISFKLDFQYMLERKLLQLINFYASRVYALNDSKTTLVAVWTNMSKILVGNDANIPLDKRLYAGGISSVRGYSSQMAGPLYKTRSLLADTKYPIGGSTCVEFGIELRKKLYKEIGAVAFIETANIRRGDKVDSSKWFSGYGFGLRYNTIVGPIRLDIAFPLKRRKNIDSKVQFYLSFGQAF